MQNYVVDPEKIERQTFDRLRELTVLDRFSKDEKQVVLHVVRACGDPVVAEKMFFSPNLIETAKKAIKQYAYILFDYEAVECGLDKDLLYQEPMCFVNKAAVISQAKANNQTRAMTAIDHWKNYCKDSITIFGQSSTGLARLLALIKSKEIDPPAVIIATNSGFVNAEKSKQSLRDSYDELGVEFVVLTGTIGGSQLAAAATNALLKLQKEIYI